MALFPQRFIDDLKAQADIVTVIEEGVSLQKVKVGTTYKGSCPFPSPRHSERHPSLYVNRENGFFHCFDCGGGGDVIKFVQIQDKVSFEKR